MSSNVPANFDEFEHLQSTFLRIHNRLVREEFNDLPSDELDLTIPRNSLRHACLLKDNDTVDMMMIRYWLFYVGLRKAQDLQQPFYGIPLDDVHSSRKFKPQVTLYFREDLADVEEGFRPVWGEISFRLMDEDSDTITKGKLTTIANRIKTEFGTGEGFLWRKGKKLFSYTEKEKGYQLQLLCRDDGVAKALVNKVLDIQGHQPDLKLFKSNVTEEESAAYPINPGTQRVLGETVKKPRRRPNVDVRFQYATADVWGLNKPITLYDRSFTLIDGLVG
jgi:hypothetical protein